MFFKFLFKIYLDINIYKGFTYDSQHLQVNIIWKIRYHINKNLPRLKTYLKNEREGILEMYFFLLSIYYIINGKTYFLQCLETR